MIVAIAVGRPGVDRLLVTSQVVLSVVLPFILFPLIWCTSSKCIMSVKKGNYSEESLQENLSTGAAEKTGLAFHSPGPEIESKVANDGGMAETAEEIVDYSNHKVTSIIGWTIWLVITAANIYALVEIGRNHP